MYAFYLLITTSTVVSLRTIGTKRSQPKISEVGSIGAFSSAINLDVTTVGALWALIFLVEGRGRRMLAALAGLGLIATGKATRKSQIPFGPFMLASAIAMIAASGLAGSRFP